MPWLTLQQIAQHLDMTTEEAAAVLREREFVPPVDKEQVWFDDVELDELRDSLRLEPEEE